MSELADFSHSPTVDIYLFTVRHDLRLERSSYNQPQGSSYNFLGFYKSTFLSAKAVFSTCCLVTFEYEPTTDISR